MSHASEKHIEHCERMGWDNPENVQDYELYTLEKEIYKAVKEGWVKPIKEENK